MDENDDIPEWLLNVARDTGALVRQVAPTAREMHQYAEESRRLRPHIQAAQEAYDRLSPLMPLMRAALQHAEAMSALP